MRKFLAGALLVVAAASLACSGGLFRQYEYEEEVYLSLDGSATVYVNSSIPALNALRGTSFNTSPTAPVDRSAVRALYTASGTHVTRVSTSRRSNRRFVHVRLDVDDIRQLGTVSPFSWSAYSFREDDGLFLYRQQVGPADGKPVGEAGWDGHELVAFRLHLPSKIAYHNALPGNLKRGNILIWEQSLEDRLSGVPLTMDARMETQSILYRTLLLFGATFLAVALGFGIVIWWVLRRGARAPAPAEAGEGQNQRVG
jgi:hypothetical protein